MQTIKILTLDDDKEMHFIIREDFKREGVNNPCEFYTNQKDFFEHFDDNTHVAIIDHYLARDVTGFEIVKGIKQRVESSPTRLAGCHIIIVSGQRNYDVFKKYTRMGCDYIDKDEENFDRTLIDTTKRALQIVHQWLSYLRKWENGVPRIK
jgi:DNA-binding NtrC family response regulator